MTTGISMRANATRLSPQQQAPRRLLRVTVIATVIFSAAFGIRVLAAQTLADDAKPPEPKTPVVQMSLPLGIRPGSTKYLLRGKNLDDITSADVGVVGATGKPIDGRPREVKILSKSKSAGAVGDTQAEIEFETSEDFRDAIAIRLKNGAGESADFRLMPAADATGRRYVISAEREPNDGFRNATPITIGEMADGIVERAQDVDVFRLRAAKGGTIAISVFAARSGSPLDAMVTVYDAHGTTLATLDDMPSNAASSAMHARDPIIDFTAPADGDYYIGLQDANDQGSGLYAYRLSVSAK